MVVEEVRHKSSECPIVLDKIGSKLPVEACAITFELEWVFPLKAIEVFFLGGGGRLLAAQLAQKGPVALGVGSAVRRLWKSPPLVLSFLVNELLDVLVALV